MLLVGLTISSIPVIRFYGAYWNRVQHLTAFVKERLRRHKAPWTPLSKVQPIFIEALIATEDRTFFNNLGVSFEGIVRSLAVDLKTHQFTQGGSTLTQQLVRDTMLSPIKLFRRKLSEALLALLVTEEYSKQQILTLYINRVYFGDGAYGIGMAAQHYFGVSPKRLTLPQASMLAGLLQAPSLLDPRTHFDAAKARQWEVLNSMVSDHVLTPNAARRAYGQPLTVIGRNTRR